ncbi:hypothetical protein EC968_008930 [Mortierella alpina]|nr:hypothetical protein EC968_008930 [Mortierella alpina]
MAASSRRATCLLPNSFYGTPLWPRSGSSAACLHRNTPHSFEPKCSTRPSLRFHSIASRSRNQVGQPHPQQQRAGPQYTTQTVTSPFTPLGHTLRTPSRHQNLAVVGLRSMSTGPDGGSGNKSSKPPGTFVTGTQWDMAPKAAAAPTPAPSSTATIAQSLRNSPLSRISTTWDPLKDADSSDSAAREGSQANIEMNLKKLKAISKVSNRKQAYSPYLLISQLPSTIMPDDIKRMAITEGSIMDVIYHRNQFMEFQNKVTVVFRSATDAVEFITQKYGKYLGGHKILMNMLDPYHPKDKRMIPPTLPIEPMSGQMVLVSGLPAASRPDNLRTEFRRFQLMDTTEAAIVPVQSRRMASTCQYLIRLSSRSEAYRFVRTYHNTYFRYSEFRRRCQIRATVIF